MNGGGLSPRSKGMESSKHKVWNKGRVQLDRITVNKHTNYHDLKSRQLEDTISSKTSTRELL